MLQINRQYRQEKPSASMRGNRIQALKLMGYHYIQQNNKKFSSRLIYVLLEGLVNLYTRNTEAQMLITGSEEDRTYVGEAIELLMREKIEGKIILGSGQGQNVGEEVERKRRRIEELEVENSKLKEGIKEQKEKYQKEVRRGNKIYQKCQHITDMLFQMKEKHQSQKKNMEERHATDLQSIIEENRRLGEVLIREKTIITLLKEQNVKAIGEKKMKMQNSMHLEQKQNKKPNFMLVNIFNVTIQPFSKHFSIQKQQINEFIIPFGKHNKLSITSSHSDSIFAASIRNDKPLCITKAVNFTQIMNTSIKIDASTGVEDSLVFEIKEKVEQRQKQALSLCSLTRVLQRRLSQSQLKVKEREEQYQKLVKYYNNLHDEWEQYKIQTCSNIEWLSKELEKSLLNTETTHQNKSPSCITSIDSSSESEIDRLKSSRQSTERSMTPINRAEEESIAQCNSFVLRERQYEDISNMISKQVISTYVLQLMDRNSQGETKEVMIDQIGACLGWGEKQFKRIEIFRRKAKINVHPSNEEIKEVGCLKQGIGDRFYRFLTLESDVEE